jgi:hypothetical protein
MFRLVSDGKAPDLQPFRRQMQEAIGKAAKQAGRDIAALMSAEQKQAVAQRRQWQREEAEVVRIDARAERQARQAEIAAAKAERRSRETIRDVVLELMKPAADLEGACGLPFGTRRIIYRIREEVRRRTGGERLEQGYFNTLLTEYEAKHGDLHPLMYRSPRGFFRVPHSIGGAVPLGTASVEAFQRPTYRFNKILYIEKEDLRLALETSGWAERNDCFTFSAIGFSTRAARDLIDAIARTSEPVTAYAVHDADGPGTCIQHTLQFATLARGARAIEIVDLGLQPWEGKELDLAVEEVVRKLNKDGTPRQVPVGDYVRARTDRAPTGETWEEWLQHHRYELNAMTAPELIAWLDRKLAERGDGKLIPPPDIIVDGFGERVRERAENAIEYAIAGRLDEQIDAIRAERDEETAEIRAEIERITAPLRQLEALLAAPFVERITAATAASDAIDREAAIRRAIERLTPKADALRAAISERFTDQPAAHWADVLNVIADDTPVGDVSDDLGEEAELPSHAEAGM